MNTRTRNLFFPVAAGGGILAWMLLTQIQKEHIQRLRSCGFKRDRRDGAAKRPKVWTRHLAVGRRGHITVKVDLTNRYSHKLLAEFGGVRVSKTIMAVPANLDVAHVNIARAVWVAHYAIYHKSEVLLYVYGSYILIAGVSSLVTWLMMFGKT